jgi:4-amino-4-deoxy-L-arabinose transferase-like glycosyltransferase
MSRVFTKHWPLFASIVILCVTTGVISTIIILRENGHLVFALDDPYIQMAMAKNFALHGVWGITRFGFTSASSSPLWTFLIAVSYMLFGVSETSPFYLSLLSGVLVLGVAYWVLRWYKLSPKLTFCALVVLVFFTPLPTLICIGSEHPLHAALTMLLVFIAARLLSDESPSTARRDLILLLAVSPVLTIVRYEGMFLILVIGALFFLRGRWRTGLAVGLAGFSSILLYGAVGLAKGWSWLPSSILLKGNFPRFTDLGTAFDSVFGPAYANIKVGPHLVALVAAALFVALYASDKRKALWDSRQLMTAIFVLLAFAHIQFCMVALFFRHESYLVALGIVVIVTQLADQLPEKLFGTPADRTLVPKHIGGVLLAAFLIYPCAVRAGVALVFLPQASKNIYEQQYQMARFIKSYYQGSTVALNDIGAVNFLADVHCLDLWGLANYEVTQLMRRHEYHTRDILRLSREAGVKVALVYDSWYTPVGGLPREWVWVGQWALPDNVVAGGDTVSIYAVDESETAPLMQKLQDFSPLLPKDVRQSGRYLY